MSWVFEYILILYTLSFQFQASAFVVTYPVNNANDEAESGNEKAMAWEKAFIQLVKVQSAHCFFHSLYFILYGYSRFS